MRRLSLLALLLSAMLQPAAASTAARPPNIVFILADDLGTPPVPTYGNAYYRTPHIDSLARDGLTFTAAYAACPVCSPTRATLMTGQYPARSRVTDFIPGNPFPFARLTQPDWQKFLPLSARTIAEELAARGYATALFGKWHLARAYTGADSVTEGPDRQGFQEVFITHKPKASSDPEGDAHGIEATTTRALDFIQRHRNHPFFLYLPYNTIHAPIMAPRALVAKHRARPGSDLPENNPVIAAMMEQFDDSIGRILTLLDALSLRENTIVIFTGDNGGLLQDAAQAPHRGGKAQLHEGGIRVPLLLRWPGVIAEGLVSDMPTSTVDFFPTLLEIAGQPPPGGTVVPPEGLAPAVTGSTRELIIDGISLLPHLRGSPAPARLAIYWHYPHYHSSGDGGPAGAVRAGDWKLIEYYEHTLAGIGRSPELYNLRIDPAETTNLAAAEPTHVARLRSLLADHRTATHAQMPTINPAYDPAKARQTGAKSVD